MEARESTSVRARGGGEPLEQRGTFCRHVSLGVVSVWEERSSAVAQFLCDWTRPARTPEEPKRSCGRFRDGA